MYVLYVYDYDGEFKILRKPGNRMFMENGLWTSHLLRADIFSREEAIKEKKNFDVMSKRPIKAGYDGGWGQAIKILKLTPDQQRARFEALQKEINRWAVRYHVLMEDLGAAMHKAVNG